MPLLGKLAPGVVQDLLASIHEAEASAILELKTPTRQGELHIEQGRVSRVVLEHQALEDALEELLGVEEGEYCLWRADERPPAFAPEYLRIWLMDPDAHRRVMLRHAIEEQRYLVATVLDFAQLSEMLTDYRPSLLLLAAAPILEQADEVAAQLKALPEGCKVLLIGTPQALPASVQKVIAGWLPWPLGKEDLHAALQDWLPSHAPLGLLSSQTLAPLEHFLPLVGPLRSSLQLQANASLRSATLRAALPDAWYQWLFASMEPQPLSYWTSRFPGEAEVAQFVIRYFLHGGVLKAEEKPIQPMTPPPTIAIAPGGGVSREDMSLLVKDRSQQESFVLLKVIVFGLRGNKREEWLDALMQISQTQSTRITRDRSVQIPYLPKHELARIPLRSDSLLVVYSALTEHAVESLLSQINTNLASFLFYVDLDKTEELQRIREIRQKLVQQYQLSDLFMVSNVHQRSREEVSQLLGGAQMNVTWHPIDTFNIRTTYKLLRILLLRTASSSTRSQKA